MKNLKTRIIAEIASKIDDEDVLNIPRPKHLLKENFHAPKIKRSEKIRYYIAK